MPFTPFTESNAHATDANKLQTVFADQGYLFLRDFVPGECARVRDDIMGVLKRHGYIPADAVEIPYRTGTSPTEEVEQYYGVVAEEISQLSSIADLSGAGPLIDLLGRLLGGDVFSFVENVERIRHVCPVPGARDLIERGETVPDATPAHQDDSFYGIPFVSVWIALMEIDELAGGLALGRRSSGRLNKDLVAIRLSAGRRTDLPSLDAPPRLSQRLRPDPSIV